MSISAKDVAKLRQMTGAGMMDSKKALVEAEGDFDKAIELLRKKGQKVAAKRADRETTEGKVFVARNGAGDAYMVALGCETDFVAETEDFKSLGNTFVNEAASNKITDKEAFLNHVIDGKSVNDLLVENIGKIGEKIEIAAYEHLNADQVVEYIHSNGKLGVIVALQGKSGDDVETLGKDIAMQVAAMRPVALDESGVPTDIVEREMQLGREKALAEGKPENIVDKIAEGMLKKYYKDNTLLHQQFVKDNSKTIQQLVKEVSADLSIKAFKRVELG